MLDTNSKYCSIAFREWEKDETMFTLHPGSYRILRTLSDSARLEECPHHIPSHNGDYNLKQIILTGPRVFGRCLHLYEVCIKRSVSHRSCDGTTVESHCAIETETCCVQDIIGYSGNVIQLGRL